MMPRLIGRVEDQPHLVRHLSSAFVAFVRRADRAGMQVVARIGCSAVFDVVRKTATFSATLWSGGIGVVSLARRAVAARAGGR